MKIHASVFKHHLYEPPIPLVREDKPLPKDKQECMTVELRYKPDDNDSAKYKLTIAYFSTGKPEEVLLFLRQLRRIIKGQNLTTGPQMFAVTRSCLRGEALRVFNNGASTHASETVPAFHDTIKTMKLFFFPAKAQQRQKRHMRHFMHKPKGMPFRKFVALLNELNDLLQEFPEDNASSLPEDEIVEISEFACPKLWVSKMLEHNFDTTTHTITELVEFCERCETVEAMMPSNQRNNTSNPGPDGNSASRKHTLGDNFRANKPPGGGNKRQKTGKSCPLHGPGHDANECKVLNDQAKKMKATWETNRQPYPRSRQNGSANRKHPRDQEINEIVNQRVAQIEKKRKEARLKREAETAKDLDNFNFDELNLSEVDSNESDGE